MLHGRDTTDKHREFLCLFDLNPDTIEQVRITLPGAETSQVERLHRDGTWAVVQFTQDGQVLRCDLDAPTMEPVILRVRRS